MARAWVKQEFNKPGNVFLEPIHRLDKVASGLVLFARTSKALSRLNESMRKGLFRKIYHARVEGQPPQKGELAHYLYHAEYHSQVVHRLHPEAKHALLTYSVLETDEKTTLVEVELHTGRYHQIRVQFAEIGHPIVGDQKYGAKTGVREIALHHVSLSFPHPVSREMLSF